MTPIILPAARAHAQRGWERARKAAMVEEIKSKLGISRIDLLSFDDVSDILGVDQNGADTGIQEIPIARIRGSVGRYRDFSQTFLPRRDHLRERWEKVSAATYTKGTPPIEVYQLGDAYFVLDGNHRVSVSRANGMTYIEAYVTEFPTPVPLDSSTTPEELFIKEGYAYFLRETALNVIRPESQVILTEPGNYPEILHHIEVHNYFMGIECKCPVTWEEAVASWYDNVYAPMVLAIRVHDMLDEFPNRSEADLYVWLIRHQAALEEQYGEPPSATATVDHFIEQQD